MHEGKELQKICVNCEYKCVNHGDSKNGFFTEKKTYYRGPEAYVKKQIKIALCLTLGNVLCGYSVGWSAPNVAKLKNPLKTPLLQVPSDKEVFWIVSCYMFGTILGANLGGFIANFIGRKSSLLIASCVTLAGLALESFTKAIWTLEVARLLIGLGTGGSALLNLVYLGEIATPRIRGSISVMTGIFHALGALLVYSIGPYMAFSSVSYVGAAISSVHLMALFFVPESPVHQLMNGKIEEAKLTLHSLGRNKKMDEELRQMVEDLQETQLLDDAANENKVKSTTTRRWRELVMEKKNRKAFLISTTLLCVQSCGGIVAVMFFATKIFQDAQSSVDPNVGTIILGITELVGVIMSPVLIERCGRRFLLMISCSICCVCMTIIGIYFYLEITNYSAIEAVRWLPLVLLMISLFAFNSGLGPVPSTISGEMFSPRLRSIGSSTALSLSWSCLLLTFFFFDDILAQLGNHGIFWMYAVINSFGLFFTVFVVPETRGKSLVEIGHLLE